MFPPRSILAPVDFSDGSRAALAFAARLAHQSKAQLHVVHAQPPLLEAAAAMRDVDLAGDTKAELAAFMQAAAPAGDWLPIHHVITGTPGDVIAAAATRYQADLIVMGPRGLSRLAETLLGSTTTAVVRHATTSVAVIPPSWQPPHPDTSGLEDVGPVVVGIDDPGSGTRLLDAAGALALSLGTDVHVVHVEERQAHDTTTRQTLASALQASHIGATATVHVVTGQTTSEALLHFVTESSREHAVLCLGQHRSGHGADTPRALIRLLTHSHVPVILVRSDAP